MTFGELRFLLSKQYPGVDLDVLDGWLQDRYRQVLQRVSWQRLEMRSLVSLVAEYATGTVTVTNGSTAITGSGTTWAATMNGRLIRIGADQEWYEFTYVSGTAGTLDREYVGASAAGASYRINKSVYALDTDVRDVQRVGLLDPETPLSRQTTKEIDRADLNRNTYGTPQAWALYMDQVSSPAVQIEVWPVPVLAGTLLVSYLYDPAVPTSASTELLPWVNVAALKAGVGADALRHGKDYGGGDRMEIVFERLVVEMANVEGRRKGGTRLGGSTPQPHRLRRYGR